MTEVYLGKPPAYIETWMKDHAEPADPTAEPFFMKGSGKIQIVKNNTAFGKILWSTDQTTWNEIIDSTELTISQKTWFKGPDFYAGDRVAFSPDWNSCNHILFKEGNIEIGGDLGSFGEADNYKFYELFKNSSISPTGKAYLTSMYIGSYPYDDMFSGCTDITEIHLPKSLEGDYMLTICTGYPNFGAVNAQVFFDL